MMSVETRESPVDRAAQSVHMAMADFFIAIQDAQTNADALRLHRLLGELALLVGAAEDAALLRAGDLCRDVVFTPAFIQGRE